MTARPVQISMDSDLLDQIDADSEAREKGRSAFICSAVKLYLKAKERREIEARLAKAYAGEAGSLLDEIEALMADAPALSDEAVSRAGIYADHP